MIEKILSATRSEDRKKMWKKYNIGHFKRRKRREIEITEKRQVIISNRFEFPFCLNVGSHTSSSIGLLVCENHKDINEDDLRLARMSLSIRQRANWARRLRLNKDTRKKDFLIFQREQNEKEEIYEAIQEEEENEEAEKELRLHLRRTRPTYTHNLRKRKMAEWTGVEDKPILLPEKPSPMR